MAKFAIFVAVEKYASSKISPVVYAEADAKELSSTLEQHSFKKSDQTVLINNRATKTTMESKIRKRIQSLADEDILYFYYAGHGFAKNGENFITCHDTDISDIDNTSIRVQWLFDLFRHSKSNKIVMFLDSCESGMLANVKLRGIYTDLTESELSEFFKDSKHCVCFAACKPGEFSHPARSLKHGIWTYHLLQALNGDAPKALEKNHLITSSSLQNYLAREVPRTIRKTRTGVNVQTPWTFGAQSSEFLIADIKSILEAKRAAAQPHLNQLRQIILRGERAISITRLTGFSKKRGHFVPDDDSAAANSFVAKIADRELNEDLEETYRSIKKAFVFKRRDISADGPSDGSGSIITPFFDYAVSIQVNPDDPSEALWNREIRNIREPMQVFSDNFDLVFNGKLHILEFQSNKSIDIEEIVDQIEDLNDDRIQVSTDRDCTYCIIRIDGLDVVITIASRSIQIEQKAGKSSKSLIEGFFTAQQLLIDQHKLKELPFSGA